MELTDLKYETLCWCFKNDLPTKVIVYITRIPYSRIEREKERWYLCNAISELEIPETYKRTFNGGKTFGFRKMKRPDRGWK